MTRGLRLAPLAAMLAAACGRPTAPSTPAPMQPSPAVTPASAPGTPVPVAPKDNGYASLRPTFAVLNASHGTQSDVALQYGFQIATDEAFANVVTKGTVAEGVDQTTFTPSVDLPAMTRIFWRAQAFTDAANDLRSGFATGTFVTPFVGPARLTISTSVPCNSFMTDLLVDGTANATDSGLMFQTTDAARRASHVMISPDGGGTADGYAMSVGQGARCSPGDYAGMYIEMQYYSAVTISGVSFATPGRIAGSLAGAIKTWNVFSDGGAIQQRTYALSIVPR